ncbi:hypothetical protein ACLBWX_18295 [Methylobacterium sp. M6A4_1b]
MSAVVASIPLFSKQIFGKFPIALILADRFSASDKFRPKLDSITIASIERPTPAVEISVLDHQDPRSMLRAYADSSAAVANSIRGRAGFYLLAGAVIAFVGLGWFSYKTSVDTKTNIAFSQTSASEAGNSKAQFESRQSNDKDKIDHLLDLLPNFGVLFFIEFIAIFFLRQYRSAMDDFRYYDAVRRQREENLVILAMYSENKTIVPTQDVIKSMTMYSGVGKLSKDETTDVIELRKMYRDELMFFEKISEIFQKNKETK